MNTLSKFGILLIISGFLAITTYSYMHYLTGYVHAFPIQIPIEPFDNLPIRDESVLPLYCFCNTEFQNVIFITVWLGVVSVLTGIGFLVHSLLKRNRNQSPVNRFNNQSPT